MPYTTPTAADLKTRYPAFTNTPDATINAYIADAGSYVDTSWFEGDYQPAIIAWAAWAMTSFGIGSGGEVANYTGQGINRLKSGTLDVSFSDSATSATGYATNVYGRLFADLLHKNKGGPRVVVGAAGCDGWGPTAILNNGGILPWAC